MSRRFPSGCATILATSGCIADSEDCEVFAFTLTTDDAAALATLGISASTNLNERWTLGTTGSTSVSITFPYPIYCACGVFVEIVGASACAMVGWHK